MNNPPTLTNEEKRRRLAQRIWLDYYNEMLFRQGIITEDTRNRMRFRIDRSCQC